eukprot:6047399-Prorocentrum_lima.AAC.1
MLGGSVASAAVSRPCWFPSTCSNSCTICSGPPGSRRSHVGRQSGGRGPGGSWGVFGCQA